jgi:hypothetical protein
MKKRLLLATVIVLVVVISAGCMTVLLASSPAPVKELTRGIIEGNVYKNEFASLSFTLPAGWVYAGDDELSQITGVVLSKNGQQASEEMLKNKIIYDMQAKNPSTKSFVSLMYENLPLIAAQNGGGDWTTLTEDDMLDSVKSQLEFVEQYDYDIGEISDAQLGALDFRVLHTVITNDNSDFCYFVRKVDKYMLCIIINAMSGDNVDDIIKYFS